MRLSKLTLSVLFILVACQSMSQSPGGVAGIETWLKANAGITGGTPVTGWANQNAGGTPTLVNGAPNINTTSTAFNYNPFVQFTGPAGTLLAGTNVNRQFIYLQGVPDLTGNNYGSLFFLFAMTDMTRPYTHIATVKGISSTTPPNGTLHGGISGGSPGINLNGYDANFEGTNVWYQNNIAVNSIAAHLNQKHILTGIGNGGTTTLNSFLGGQNDNISTSFVGHNRDWRGPVAEVIGFSTNLNNTDRIKVQTYLALKYGLTINHDYVSVNNTTIYSNTAPFNNDIIGISRDDNEALHQKQSHTENDLVRIYLGTLTANNTTNGGAFSNDHSHIIIGSNGGQLCSTSLPAAEIPTGLTNCTIYSRLEREWKVQKTSTNNTFNMDVNISACGVPGSVDIADLRFLVDNDGNFANGGTLCYYNGDAAGTVITYNNPIITISNINNTHIPNNSVRYVTIASIDIATPLPVELIKFNAALSADERYVDLTWQTASEINNDYFILEKSLNTKDWAQIERIKGAGTTTEVTDYATIDDDMYNGTMYYRLIQVDFNGESTYSKVRAVTTENTTDIHLYPNPANSTVTIVGASATEISMVDAMGKRVNIMPNSFNNGVSVFNTSNLAEGIYFIRIDNSPNGEVKKLIISHH